MFNNEPISVPVKIPLFNISEQQFVLAEHTKAKLLVQLTRLRKAAIPLYTLEAYYFVFLYTEITELEFDWFRKFKSRSKLVQRKMGTLKIKYVPNGMLANRILEYF